MIVDKPKRKEVAHDETPAIISDHAFVPRDKWWSLCKQCGLAQSAHIESSIDSLEAIKEDHKNQISYYADDNPEVFD